ncbi:MAG: arginine--tRNA ligase, partial [Rubripirellula sp.]
MHVPNLLQSCFLEALQGLTENPATFASMIRATTDPAHGDYQANCAMPLSKKLGGKNPREVASELVSKLELGELCEPAEIAGPGFINLKLKDSFLTNSLKSMLGDSRCAVPAADSPSSIVIDFSSPNVAKPMHVGHIRSTVIGDSLARILRFLGHNVITDNHLGDWGTQFGIIIYGYKHFGDPAVVDANPVQELTNLYRIVNQLIEYRKAVNSLEALRAASKEADAAVENANAALQAAEAKEQKKAKKAVANAERKRNAAAAAVCSAEGKIAAVENDDDLHAKAEAHPTIDKAVLAETAKLHQGDAENIALWEKFLPHCQDEINRVYDRLDIQFDHTLGESFYHSMLADVVKKLRDQGLASDSDGAVCVFLPDFKAPMIVQKQDGAYLYATTDLATMQYRLEQFQPNEILYV